MSAPSPKRPLSNDERTAIALLHGVTFPVASWDKRFHRDVLINAEHAGEISDKAAAQLWRLFIRYRRQYEHADKVFLLTVAQGMAAPDYRKQQAAANEQARIDEMKKRYAEVMK